MRFEIINRSHAKPASHFRILVLADITGERKKSVCVIYFFFIFSFSWMIYHVIHDVKKHLAVSFLASWFKMKVSHAPFMKDGVMLLEVRHGKRWWTVNISKR